MSDSVRPQRWQPTRLPRPWDSPGKSTGVGCHRLLLSIYYCSWNINIVIHPQYMFKLLITLFGSSLILGFEGSEALAQMTILFSFISQTPDSDFSCLLPSSIFTCFLSHRIQIIVHNCRFFSVVLDCHNLFELN